MSLHLLQICAAAERDEAQTALNHAENALASAYLAVFNAEKAGANVSSLISKLDVAADWLARANNAFRLGDYNEAREFANICINNVEDLADEAEILMLVAQKSLSEKLFWSAAYSSIGISFLFVFSLFGWRYLKRFYIKRVLKMKPEVISEDEFG
ncbi:MAG: hypothetical protein QXQ94_08350 [Candidatus Bathyarchaeia archaeon]